MNTQNQMQYQYCSCKLSSYEDKLNYDLAAEYPKRTYQVGNLRPASNSCAAQKEKN